MPLNNEHLSERIAYFAFALSHGQIGFVLAWLQRLKCELHSYNAHEAVVKGLTGVTVELIKTDPVSCGVQLGFALAGQHWPQVYGGLLPLINKRWKERNKLLRRLELSVDDLADPIMELEVRNALFPGFGSSPTTNDRPKAEGHPLGPQAIVLLRAGYG